jgi:plastocyanin
MSRFTRNISASLVFALAACGGSGSYGGGVTNPPPPPPPPPPVSGTTVNATPSIAFTPATLTVDAGAIVTFAFGSLGHNVTFDTPDAATPADIPGINANVNVARTFSTAGTYRYHCTIHPGMSGSVVVR